VENRSSKEETVLLSNLFRWGGLAAMLAAVLLVIADLMGLTFRYYDPSEALTTGFYALQSVLTLLVSVLLLFALVGLHARHSEAAGVLGLVGFLAAFLGTALAVGANWSNAFFAPTVAIEAPGLFEAGLTGMGRLGAAYVASYSLYVLGWLLFGLAALGARVYPRVAAVVLMIGALLILVPLPGTAVVFAFAVAWLGFTLFSGRDVSTERPSRVESNTAPTANTR
jgi:hypothetical protein